MIAWSFYTLAVVGSAVRMLMVNPDGGTMAARPLFVAVSGKPGAGKSTLARRLAAEDALWLPHVSCDQLRHGLRVSGAPSAGLAGIEAFYGTIDFLLERGISLIADLSFRRGLGEQELLARAARCRVVSIHCEVPTDLAQQRFMARQQIRPPTRGVGRVAAEMESGAFDWSIFEPLEIAVPRLIIDTRDGYLPGLAAIIAFCLAHRDEVGE